MKEKKKYLNPYKRKIVIDEKTWSYRVTRSTVEICDPNCLKKNKFFIDNDVDFDCLCEKPCSCFEFYDGPKKKPVKPKHINKVINSLILKKENFFKEQGTKEDPLKIGRIFDFKYLQNL